MAEKHYTAIISINRVDRRQPGPKDYGEREVTEVVKIALKAKDIDSLKTNIAAHIALVEDSE